MVGPASWFVGCCTYSTVELEGAPVVASCTRSALADDYRAVEKASALQVFDNEDAFVEEAA